MDRRRLSELINTGKISEDNDDNGNNEPTTIRRAANPKRMLAPQHKAARRCVCRFRQPVASTQGAHLQREGERPTTAIVLAHAPDRGFSTLRGFTLTLLHEPRGVLLMSGRPRQRQRRVDKAAQNAPQNMMMLPLGGYGRHDNRSIRHPNAGSSRYSFISIQDHLQNHLDAGSSRCRIISTQNHIDAESSRCRVISMPDHLDAGPSSRSRCM